MLLLIVKLLITESYKVLRYGPVILFMAAGVFSVFLIDGTAAVRSYPVFVNFGMGALFAYTL